LAFEPHVFTPELFRPHPPILDGRNGPFALIFALTGFWMAKKGWRPPLRAAVQLCVLGAALHLGEAYWVDANQFIPFHRNEFLLGTLPFSIGAFLIALQLAEGRVVRMLARLGAYSLGLYAVHIVFVLIFSRFVQPSNVVEGLLLAGLVIVASTITVLGLARIRPLRFLIA
jgi:peptidoglycan/LPS O-acetylase OafA/YrhL